VTSTWVSDLLVEKKVVDAKTIAGVVGAG